MRIVEISSFDLWLANDEAWTVFRWKNSKKLCSITEHKVRQSPAFQIVHELELRESWSATTQGKHGPSHLDAPPGLKRINEGVVLVATFTHFQRLQPVETNDQAFAFSMLNQSPGFGTICPSERRIRALASS